MKKIFLSLLTILFSGIALAQQASLVFPETVTIQPGKTTVFSVGMNNEINLNSLSFEIAFPAGISIQSYFDEEECDDVYSIEMTERGRTSATPSVIPTTRGGIQIAIYHSNYKQYFKDNSGDVLNITIEADKDLATGTYPVQVTNINFGDMDGQALFQDDVTFNVIVAKECSINVAASEHGTVALSPQSESYLSGTEITATATPSEGYQFVKWTNGAVDLSTENPYKFTVEDDMTLVPVFEAKEYKVTFCDEDGTVISEQTLPYGSSITAPENPEKEGYTFTGWNPVVDATVPAHDVTYTAVYQVNQYKVTFCDEDGTVISEQTLDYGSNITAPSEPKKEGYTFVGWNPEVDATVPAHDVTYTAVYQINQYKVTFCDEDGTVISEQTLDYGSNITAPENPEKEGYTFTGWNPDVDATVPAHDVTYTAVYKVNQYTVYYKYEGNTVHEESVNYGDVIPTYTWAPENDEDFTYAFKGWNSEDGEVYTTMPAHDIVFIADIEKVSGIEMLILSGKTFDVYSINGTKVKSAVYATELKNVLTKGIYVVDGIKIVVK